MTRTVSALVLVVIAWIAIGGAMTAAAGPLTHRGELVDIGGRRMRIVCEGPISDKPTVLMESGAFGFSADWGAIQPKLTQMGIRSCAYDRAGMGLSDPGPGLRDSEAIVGDLEKLLAAKGEKGPFVLMGHSMAGLHMRLFAARNPDKVRGLVLVDAANPDTNLGRMEQRFVGIFVPLSNAAAVLASVGGLKPLASTGDHIGLPPEAAREKRWAFASGRHNRTAAAEVRNWNRSAAEAAAAAPYDPDWPVAIILAGRHDNIRTESRALAAQRAHFSYYDVAPTASHASILGQKESDVVVRGLQFVLEKIGRPVPPPAS